MKPNFSKKEEVSQIRSNQKQTKIDKDREKILELREIRLRRVDSS